MKAEISAEGVLTVQGETELEFFALNIWHKSNGKLVVNPEKIGSGGSQKDELSDLREGK